MKKVVGVKFKQVGKIYHFECCNNEKYEVGSKVIVETARGIEYDTVAVEQKLMSEEKLIHPLKPILRLANYDDIKTYEKNLRDASEAMEICRQKVAQHGLDMNLIDNEYTFDKTKLIFYFTADGRVDFRELVRDLASVFRTRIELRQIGVRDEAKKLGGFGPCGREYCCKRWMGDFEPVTIKMAKDQGLSLNPGKISGTCGRLFCCLKYENENYEGIIKKMPTENSIVMTPEGKGKVIQRATLLEKVKVLLETEDGNVQFKDFHLSDIKVLKLARAVHDSDEQISEEELKKLED